MSGRPVRLLTAATIAAAASTASITAASAGCYSGCGGYAAPVAHYSAPVVYSYSYAAPVSYAPPCSPCGGYGSYGYARPMYVVNQGPSFNEPVVGEAEGVYDTGYRRAYPHYSEGGIRWHRRHWHRGHGYRGHRNHLGLRHHGLRHGYRHHGRYGMRHPMAGPRGMHRMHGPRMGMHGPRHMNMHRMHRRMHMNRMPGVVHPK